MVLQTDWVAFNKNSYYNEISVDRGSFRFYLDFTNFNPLHDLGQFCKIKFSLTEERPLDFIKSKKINPQVITKVTLSSISLGDAIVYWFVSDRTGIFLDPLMISEPLTSPEQRDALLQYWKLGSQYYLLIELGDEPVVEDK